MKKIIQKRIDEALKNYSEKVAIRKGKVNITYSELKKKLMNCRII